MAITTATATANVDKPCNIKNKNNAASTKYVVTVPLMNILSCYVKAMTNNEAQYRARVHDVITLHRVMATTTRPRLQQQPLLSMSPFCTGA
jgi:hypothetical protein